MEKVTGIRLTIGDIVRPTNMPSAWYRCTERSGTRLYGSLYAHDPEISPPHTIAFDRSTDIWRKQSYDAIPHNWIIVTDPNDTDQDE